jgi:ubiquinol oxidase
MFAVHIQLIGIFQLEIKKFSFFQYLPIFQIILNFFFRFVGYLEEEAVAEYNNFLNAIDKGAIENVAAPDVAIKYWNLHPDSKIRDVVLVVRADECMHRNVNHIFSNTITAEKGKKKE